MVDTLKSGSITNLDASPVVENTTGNGGPGYVKTQYDNVTPTTGGLASTSSTYKILRVPTTIKLNALSIKTLTAIETSTGLALDVGAYYSDSTTDGTQPTLQGTAISVNCFAAASTFQSLTSLDCLTAYSIPKRQQPLWQGLGLASDPGGFIDIVVAVHTAATGAVSSPVQLKADFIAY